MLLIKQTLRGKLKIKLQIYDVADKTTPRPANI